MSFFKDLNDKLNESLEPNAPATSINEGKGCKECDVKEGKGKKCEGCDKDIDEGKVADEEYIEEALTESTTFYVCNECGALMECGGTCPECNEGVLEEAMKLVVKDGKVTKKKVKARKKKLTSKQKAALAKARKKANTGSAKKARAKSMKVRAKKVHESEEFECPVCDYVGSMEEIEDGVFVCPECGAELEIDNESIAESEAPKSKADRVCEYLGLLEVPDEVCNEGMDACVKYLADEFGIYIED